MEKEVMHDLGVLGKWSESTLKANKKLLCFSRIALFNCSHTYGVDYIESTYEQMISQITQNIKELQDMQLKKMRLNDLRVNLDKIKHLEKSEETLRMNYQK